MGKASRDHESQGSTETEQSSPKRRLGNTIKHQVTISFGLRAICICSETNTLPQSSPIWYITRFQWASFSQLALSKSFEIGPVHNPVAVFLSLCCSCCGLYLPMSPSWNLWGVKSQDCPSVSLSAASRGLHWQQGQGAVKSCQCLSSIGCQHWDGHKEEPRHPHHVTPELYLGGDYLHVVQHT